FLLHSWSAQKSRRATIIAGGQGAVFWDAEGKRYLDFASQLVNLNLGFGHPRVVEAIQAQAAELCYVAPEFANAQRGRLARAVAEVTPGDLNRVFFTTGGATANEAAIRMARLARGVGHRGRRGSLLLPLSVWADLSILRHSLRGPHRRDHRV